MYFLANEAKRLLVLLSNIGAKTLYMKPGSLESYQGEDLQGHKQTLEELLIF